jgi:hypothetical protein
MSLAGKVCIVTGAAPAAGSSGFARITAEMGGTEIWGSLIPGGVDDVAHSVEAS